MLDPFAGRGTAVYAAATAGRVGLGVEINPVGWVYAAAKLHPAPKHLVLQRIEEIASLANRYREAARSLPEFFTHCYTPDVRRYLLASRDNLEWRTSVVDRTVMAILLVNLHGKRSSSLSNQMRQTKAMAPNYAVGWWKERDLKPPKLNASQFLKSRVEWRYAKGLPEIVPSTMILGDSTKALHNVARRIETTGKTSIRLLLTSPPYYRITNYHYDQWIRLWLLGGLPSDSQRRSPFGGDHRGKFGDLVEYESMLQSVFSRTRDLCDRKSVIYVRSDWREPTRSITRRVLETTFTDFRIVQKLRPVKGVTQTRLFGHYAPKMGEVDFILTGPAF